MPRGVPSDATLDSHLRRSGVMCSTTQIPAISLPIKAMEPLSLGTSSTWQKLSRRAHLKHLAPRAPSGGSASLMKPTSTPPLYGQRRGGQSASDILHRSHLPNPKLKMDDKIVVRRPPNMVTSTRTRRPRKTRNSTKVRIPLKWSTYGATAVVTTLPKADKTATAPSHNVTHRNPPTFDTSAASYSGVKLFTTSYSVPHLRTAKGISSPPKLRSICAAPLSCAVVAGAIQFYLFRTFPSSAAFRFLHPSLAPLLSFENHLRGQHLHT